MKKTVWIIMAVAGLMLSSCASKKELANCRDENGLLLKQLQLAKEDLAGKNVRIGALEGQVGDQKKALEEQKKAYDRLQELLDKSLLNASQNNVSIDKLVDQINESNQYIRHLVEVKSKSDPLTH